MIIDELTDQIKHQFSFDPSDEQREAMLTFAHFLVDRHDRSVMVLSGSAGTGKTSLASAFVRTMKALRQRVVLLAPTGRAAKVFSLNSGHAAHTIHRRIYRERSYADLDGVFNLNRNLSSDTLFMVDESSMIANQGQDASPFGSGRLLDDLIQFVYSGRNCRLLLIGDAAQLPPVGEEASPALQSDVLEAYGLTVFRADLRHVLRQSRDSGILFNATLIRDAISREAVSRLPQIRFRGFADICRLPGDELIESLNTSYAAVGIDETMVITRSNKRANIYNNGIRNTVLGREDQLTTGDMIMIVKNNYYWTERERVNAAAEAVGRKVEAPAAPAFLANGDRARVERVRNVRELYGFRFADVRLRFPDYDDYELSTTLILNSIDAEAPALTREQNEQLYGRVMDDYADLPLKCDRLGRLRQDPYFNALQVKYAYAVTCHKAQGGQWAHIYLDQGYMTSEMLTPDYLHWLYTAFTRATEKLFLVNWPVNQTESDER